MKNVKALYLTNGQILLCDAEVNAYELLNQAAARLGVTGVTCLATEEANCIILLTKEEDPSFCFRFSEAAVVVWLP